MKQYLEHCRGRGGEGGVSSSRRARTSKDVGERAEEAVLREGSERQCAGTEALVALKDVLVARGVVAAVQLQVDAGEVHLPQHL